ncbi:MAG: hypothetical protein NTZ16_12715, partial [Verrucomicrobia bacterium]|nr:hypothetical protein [Verrucomicrobiota bacterium]
MKFEIKNLRVGLLAFLLSAFSFSAFAAFNFVGVYTTTNGALLAPTNFFKVNSNLLNAAVAASGGGTSTNGLASTNYVNTATNTLWLVLSNADWNTLQSMAALSNAHRAALTWTTNRFDTQALTNAALQAGIDGKLAQTLTNNPPMFVNGDAVIPLLHAAPGDFWVPQDSLKDWEWSINISGHAATATDPDAVHTGDIGNTVLAPNGDGSGLDLSGNTSVSAANVTGLGTMALEDAGSFIAKTDGEANGTFRFVGTNYVTNTNLLWTDCGSGLSLWTWSGNRYTNIYTAPPFDLGYVTNRSGVWTLCGSGGSVVSSNLSFPTGQWLPEGECFLDSHYGWTTNAVTVNDGNVSANSFTGNGSGVTHINPANIDAGTAAIDISGNAATAATANSAQSLLEGIGGNTFAYAEDGDNPRWVSSLQIYAPNFSGNVGSTNITGALTNNTTGNAATAS